MKTRKVLYVNIMFLIAFWLSACNNHSEHRLTVKNPSDFDRVDEPVVLSRSEIENKIGPIAPGLSPLLVTKSGDTLPTQSDDLTGDGLWDEIFSLISIKARGTEKFKIVLVEESALPSFPVRTNIRMARILPNGVYEEVASARRLTAEDGLAANIFHLEGPAWENDEVGFRNYFDVRNGMDIYGKVRNDMVLDRAGINEDYHFMQKWGMDILRVGTSLGAGSLAIQKNGTLFRVAPESQGVYELIAEGPLRSMLRLKYNYWQVDNDTISLVHDISIRGGAWFYESRVTLSGPVTLPTLISGISTMSLDDQGEVMTSEGKIQIVSTFGKQSYNKEYLGLAIMLPATAYAGYELTGTEADHGITNSALIKMNAENKLPAIFRFYAAWEVSDPRFSDKNYFSEFLKKEATKWAEPLQVKFR